MGDNDWFDKLTSYYGLLDEEATELIADMPRQGAMSRYAGWLRERRESVLHMMERDCVSWDEARLLARYREDEMDAGAGLPVSRYEPVHLFNDSEAMFVIC